jgi:hypothetical protein
MREMEVMGVLESQPHLSEDGQGFLYRERAARLTLDAIPQGPFGSIVGNQVWALLVYAALQDGQQVRMLQHGEQANFLQKLQLLLRGEVYAIPEFKSDRTLCSGIPLSPKHPTHTIVTDFSLDPIVPDELADVGMRSDHTHLPQDMTAVVSPQNVLRRV